MAAKPLPAAIKLLTGQLAHLTTSDKKFRTSQGLEFQRVWLQGRVANVSSDGNSFEVMDDTGPPLTVCCRASAGARVPGEYVLVVGKLGLKRLAKKDDGNRSQGEDPDRSKGAGGKRRKDWQLAGQKVRPLSDASRRADLWHREVRFLHQYVYPRVAQQGQVPR